MQQSLNFESNDHRGDQRDQDFDPQQGHSNLMTPAPPIKIIRNYLNRQQQRALLDESRDYPFTRPEIKVFGNKHVIPRSQVWFGDLGCDYRFSSLLIDAQPWFNYVFKLRKKLESDFSCQFNGALVNHYTDGQQSVGWHSDDEPEIIAGSTIASITLGASRDFIIRHNDTRYQIGLQLHSGDLLLMMSPMQQQWQHTLPKRLKITKPRINYTFRQLIKNYHR